MTLSIRGGAINHAIYSSRRMNKIRSFRTSALGHKQSTILKLFTVAMQHKLERCCDATASICEAVPFRARSSLLRCPHTCGKEHR